MVLYQGLPWVREVHGVQKAPGQNARVIFSLAVDAIHFAYSTLSRHYGILFALGLALALIDVSALVRRGPLPPTMRATI